MSRGRPGSPVSVVIYCRPLLAGAESPPDISHFLLTPPDTRLPERFPGNKRAPTAHRSVSILSPNNVEL